MSSTVMSTCNKQLSQSIEKLYTKTRHDESYIASTIELTEYIEDCIQYLQNTEYAQYPNWSVYKFGSSSCGTDTHGESDIDLAISLNFGLDIMSKKILLGKLGQIISANDECGFLTVKPLCSAQYPVIKIRHIKYKSIKYDISIDDGLCLRRNKFMVEYMNYYTNQCHIPIRKLIVFIKFWSKQRAVTNTYGYLSSFGFTLMIIQFIQSHLKKNNHINCNIELG
eukprot:49139_1